MPKLRRTQEERRGATVRKLLDAAADTLVEVGYARCTVQEICGRAEVSQGGLFRHFATREELMVAVGRDVGERILARYQEEFERLAGHADPLRISLELLRSTVRSPLNQAWVELAVAARTNAVLRTALAPVAERYYADIEALGRKLVPDLASALGPQFAVLLDTVITIFDGENVHRLLVAKPEIEAQRIELLLALLRLRQ
jgi:AcrR family transcriptional regulator